LSHVDGERGVLIIAGEHIADVAGKSSFEGVTARLWTGATGKALGEANVRASLGAARERTFLRLGELLPATRGLSIVDGFRAATFPNFFLFVADLRDEVGESAHVGFEAERTRINFGGKDVVDGDSGGFGTFAHEGRLRNNLRKYLLYQRGRGLSASIKTVD